MRFRTNPGALAKGLCGLAVVLLASLPYPALAQVGWSISPGELRVDGIRLGEGVSLPLTLVNNHDGPLSISLSPSLPLQLRPGYEPIPDTSWVSFSPTRLTLAPHSREEITVSLSVPSQGEWGGKSYECWLTATANATGVIQLALNSRLLLSTSTAYKPSINWGLAVGIGLLGAIVGGAAYANRRELRSWLTRW